MCENVDQNISRVSKANEWGILNFMFLSMHCISKHALMHFIIIDTCEIIMNKSHGIVFIFKNFFHKFIILTHSSPCLCALLFEENWLAYSWMELITYYHCLSVEPSVLAIASSQHVLGSGTIVLIVYSSCKYLSFDNP